MNNLKIEVVHDITCSWCPIGYANVKNALENLNLKADFYFLPLELNPGLGEEGEEIAHMFARRHQWDDPKLQSYRRNLLSVAHKAGVEIDFSKRTHYFNTRKAHRLIHFSEVHKKQVEANELLIQAYFKNGLDISEDNVLVNISNQLELDSKLARNAINSEVTDLEMAAKHQRVKELGLAGTPVFILNEREIIRGSNSVSHFEKSLGDLQALHL